MSIFSNTPFDPSTWDPSTWTVPPETPSTFDDPSFPENRYQIAFHNASPHTINMYCMAFSSRNGMWTGNPNHFWTINPGQDMALDFPGIGPFVGNFFHFFAMSINSSVAWGTPQAPFSTNVGPPYNTSGGFRVFTETLALA
jgi:hypothetical protein